jgi:hypothetical protein
MVCFTLSAFFLYLPPCPLLLFAHKTSAEGKKKAPGVFSQAQKGR